MYLVSILYGHVSYYQYLHGCKNLKNLIDDKTLLVVTDEYNVKFYIKHRFRHNMISPVSVPLFNLSVFTLSSVLPLFLNSYIVLRRPYPLKVNLL